MSPGSVQRGVDTGPAYDLSMSEVRTSSWADGEIVGFDLETTGTDPNTALPVSFSFVTFLDHKQVQVETSPVDPGCEIPAGAQTVHHISTERARSEGVSLENAARIVIDALLDASTRSVPVAGMNLGYDLTIIDRLSRAYDGSGLFDAGFSSPVLDALVIDRHLDPYRRDSRRLADLCRVYGVEQGDLHDACADAAMAVKVVLAIADHSPGLALAAPGALTAEQEGWHAAWAESYSTWRVRNGQGPLAPEGHTWPVRACEVPPSLHP